MDAVVSSAVNMCSSVYSLVGLFGYVAFYNLEISGNVLVGFPNTFFTKIVKMAFVLTVIVSFPLCLFPARSSLHSLAFKAGVHELPGNLIPDHRFRLLTFLLVAVTIGTAIMLPNIEFVLGILGSTIGTTICFILPALIFICNTTKDTNERIMAKVILSIGVFILLACSYSTLHNSQIIVDPISVKTIPTNQPKLGFKPIVDETSKKSLNANHLTKADETVSPKLILEKVDLQPKIIQRIILPEKIENDQRQEPPIPQEPEERKVDVKPEVKSQKPEKNKQEEIMIEKSVRLAEKTPLSVPEAAKVGDASKQAKEVVMLQEESVLDPDALKKEDKELNSQKKPINLEILKKVEQEKKDENIKLKRKEAEEAASSKKQDELLRKKSS